MSESITSYRRGRNEITETLEDANIEKLMQAISEEEIVPVQTQVILSKKSKRS